MITPVNESIKHCCNHVSRCWYYISPGEVSALPKAGSLLSAEASLQTGLCLGLQMSPINQTARQCGGVLGTGPLSDKFPGCTCHEVHYRKGLIPSSPFLQKLFVYCVHWLGNSSHQSSSREHRCIKQIRCGNPQAAGRGPIRHR